MASALTEAHIDAQARLRSLTTDTVASIWRSLPAHDREQVDEWLSRVLPVVGLAQRQSAALTEAYLARYLGRQPLGILADYPRPVPAAEVYERPFVTVWTALAAGQPFADAVAGGLARATETAAMDVQMTMRATADSVQAADEGIFGYQRVADAGACEFCSALDGAYVKFADAMAIHNHCGCSLEPLTEPHPRAAKLPSGVAVHRHGELGAVLGSADHSFTGPSDL